MNDDSAAELLRLRRLEYLVSKTCFHLIESEEIDDKCADELFKMLILEKFPDFDFEAAGCVY